MNNITQDMALQVLDVLRTVAGTQFDHITIGADTDWATMVAYNPNMNGGEWEFTSVADTTESIAITDIYEASEYIIGLDMAWRR